jgi:hypothetical protein
MMSGGKGQKDFLYKTREENFKQKKEEFSKNISPVFTLSM